MRVAKDNSSNVTFWTLAIACSSVNSGHELQMPETMSLSTQIRRLYSECTLALLALLRMQTCT